MSSSGERSPLERVFGHPGTWLAIVLAVVGFNLARAFKAKLPDPPGVYVSIPEFRLTDQLGHPFGSAELKGKIWIANFIFTSCPTMCPQLTETMRKIKRRVRGMGAGVHLVSFSVDPERDTPEKLLEYGKKYGASPTTWSFLTGDLEQVKEAVVLGFKMPMDPGEEDERGIFDITHGTRFVLVDSHSRVRGYYESDEAGVAKLLFDIKSLTAHEAIEGSRPPISVRAE